METDQNPQYFAQAHQPAPSSVMSGEQQYGHSQVQASEPSQLRPSPVVMVLSPVGVEYIFQTITLFTGAISAIVVLLALFNGKTGLSDLAFPAAVLLITVPVFAFLFLRHKKMELANPDQRMDPSKRRSTQFTQIVAFTACLFTLIGFVSDVFLKVGGQSGPSIFKAFLDMLAILIVAGGILYYYWRDEHKG